MVSKTTITSPITGIELEKEAEKYAEMLYHKLYGKKAKRPRHGQNGRNGTMA